MVAIVLSVSIARTGPAWSAGTLLAEETPPLHYQALPPASVWGRFTIPNFEQVATAQATSAIVRAIRDGAAEYTTNGLAWAPLTLGTLLYSGTTIRTGPDCVVDLFLKQNGPVLRLMPDTGLGLRKLTCREEAGETVIETILDLVRGRILGSVKKLSPRSRYEIVTPSGTIAVRGTQFDISANGRVTVIEGVALVRVPKGLTFSLSKGMTFDPSTLPDSAEARPPVGPKRLFGEE